ncbi:MAG: hypothetical protein GY847_26355 [Proteobacteria bacterium]|nr:hypothetical protein [Pseudomonadota bacterium]
MGNNRANANANQKDAGRLLGRGSKILGLAALAHARGQRAGTGPWHTLSKEIVAASEEVLEALEQEPDPTLLEAVIRAAMAPNPATAAPTWAETLWRDPLALSRVGTAVDSERLAPALGPKCNNSSDRQKGLAALAVALSRSIDGLRALAENLPEEDRDAVVRMASLAAVVVEPGEPTRMRADIRKIIKEEIGGG